MYACQTMVDKSAEKQFVYAENFLRIHECLFNISQIYAALRIRLNELIQKINLQRDKSLQVYICLLKRNAFVLLNVRITECTTAGTAETCFRCRRRRTDIRFCLYNLVFHIIFGNTRINFKDTVTRT